MLEIRPQEHSSCCQWTPAFAPMNAVVMDTRRRNPTVHLWLCQKLQLKVLYHEQRHSPCSPRHLLLLASHHNHLLLALQSSNTDNKAVLREDDGVNPGLSIALRKLRSAMSKKCLLQFLLFANGQMPCRFFWPSPTASLLLSFHVCSE